MVVECIDEKLRPCWAKMECREQQSHPSRRCRWYWPISSASGYSSTYLFLFLILMVVPVVFVNTLGVSLGFLETGLGAPLGGMKLSMTDPLSQEEHRTFSKGRLLWKGRFGNTYLVKVRVKFKYINICLLENTSLISFLKFNIFYLNRENCH